MKQTQYKGQRQRLIISHVFFLLLCNFLSASCRLVDWTAVPTMGKASFLFFNLFIFNWRIITLQYCVLFKLKVCSVVRPVASPSAWKVLLDHLRPTPSPTSHLCSNGTFSARPSLPALFSITPQPFQAPGLYAPILPVTSSLCILHLSIMSIVYLHPKVERRSLFCSPFSPQHLKEGLAHSGYLTKTFTE